MLNTSVTTTYLAEAADAARWQPTRHAPGGCSHRSGSVGALEEGRMR